MSEPTLPRIDHCRSCGAAIRWCRHRTTGRPAPIDAEPGERGNIRLDGAQYEVVRRETADGPGPWYTNHFMTCPHAAQHKRTRGDR